MPALVGALAGVLLGAGGRAARAAHLLAAPLACDGEALGSLAGSRVLAVGFGHDLVAQFGSPSKAARIPRQGQPAAPGASAHNPPGPIRLGVTCCSRLPLFTQQP